jgi:hydroxypyruvate isomerase
MVKDLSELADTGASFGLMTGYIKGDLIDDESNARLIDTAAQSIKASKNINCPG